MAGSMKEIKLRIKSVESTMQITKAMELVASSKLGRAKERVEHSRPYFETLYATLFDIAAADSEFSSPYLAKRETHRRLYIVIAGDRGLAGGYNANILKAVEANAADAPEQGYCVLPIGKKAVEYFERHNASILTTSFAVAGDISVSDCFEISRLVCEEPGVSGLHNLRTRRIGDHYAIEMHVRMPGAMTLYEAHRHATDIEQNIKHAFGSSTHVIVHLEPLKENGAYVEP